MEELKSYHLSTDPIINDGGIAWVLLALAQNDIATAQYIYDQAFQYMHNTNTYSKDWIEYVAYDYLRQPQVVTPEGIQFLARNYEDPERFRGRLEYYGHPEYAKWL